MRRVILYIAISLDGFIAKEDGDVGWLEDIPNSEGSDFGYADFYATVDTVLMGNETYRFVQNYGGPFPYPDRENFVFTRDTTREADEHVRFVSNDPAAFVRELKKQPGGDIWLVGGGQINTLCWNAGLIDVFQITVMPIVLGAGIPLFGGRPELGKLRLRKHQAYANGIVQLEYENNV